MKTIDKYIYKALDYYPFNLEETTESLDYALSYDENNPTALTLYGRLLSEQLQNHEEAKVYFEKALAANIQAIEVYLPFIETLIKNEDYDQAQKMIDFALKTKGTKKTPLMLKKVMLLEIFKKYKKALKTLKYIKSMVVDTDDNDLIEETEKRLKFKLRVNKKPEKEKKKKK
jgi:tetratricopeptide (TPR) repeat protein